MKKLGKYAYVAPAVVTLLASRKVPAQSGTKIPVVTPAPTNPPPTAAASDKRLKQNVQTLESALDKVGQLRGVSFEWKDARQPGTQIGVIAQEIETVLPELVLTNSEGYKSVAYSQITAVLIEAVKELKAQNEELKAKITAKNAE